MFENFRARLFGAARQSHQAAKNRLQMVLVQDRSGLSSEEMELFRKDLLEVISRYFVMEKTRLDIEWQRNELSTALIINTPVVGRPRGGSTKTVSVTVNAS